VATTIVIACPECKKQIKVPGEVQGKKIRCKGCGAAFTAQPVAAAPKAPAAKPGKSPKSPQAAGPVNTRRDDLMKDFDDEGPKQYTVISENLAPRCPHCALPMDPPDARICIHCGYDMQKRQRHEHKRTYDQTGTDFFLYWLPAILALIGFFGLVALNIFCWIKMEEWLTGTWIEMETAGADGKKEWLIKPGAFTLYFVLFPSVFYHVWALRFCYKRFIKNPWPPEVVKKDEDYDEDDYDDDE
jgi:hypothetical protein